jgi:hypothetical protein
MVKENTATQAGSMTGARKLALHTSRLIATSLENKNSSQSRDQKPDDL